MLFREQLAMYGEHRRGAGILSGYDTAARLGSGWLRL